MHLDPIERRTGLSREEFQSEYLEKGKPVVFTDLSEPWPATKKWTYDFFISKYGHLKVPLYDTSAFHNAGKGYMSPSKHMSFGDYLTLIQNEPTDLRMFLFNIFKEAPELREDFSMPTVMDGWITSHPFLFFGGEGSYVNLHYDIDCSAVFLTQFSNRKKVILFDPHQSTFLYNHPFTVQAHVDVLHPDYEKFPAFKYAKGYETIIQDGETVFIPPLFWHYIHYMDGGYSMSLRANDRISTRVRGLWNVTRHFVVDKGMNMVMGSRWKSLKEDIAKKRAEALVD